MPCRDYMDDHGSGRTEYIENPINTKLQKRADMLSRLLCFILTDITRDAGKTLGRLMNNRELRIWWEAHQIADAKEEQRKKQLIIEDKIKNSLSDLEKKIRENPNKYYNEK